MTIRTSVAIALAVASLSVRPCRAAETLASLAARIPSQANALVLIDVEKTLAAPLAVKQGWAKKLETAYAERPVFLPPEARKLALGAVLQADRDFLADRELAIMELVEPPSIRSIARNESGYVEEVSGQQAAFTPRDAAYVDLGANVLAVARPANRQYMARWISATQDSAPHKLSDYLQSSLALATDRVQIMLAVDLTDVLGPHDIETRLADATWLAAKHANVAAISKIVATLRGAALRVAVNNDCQGQLQIDFDADVAPLGDLAKPLVLQALGNLGFQTSELEDWRVSLAPKSIRMQGTLSAGAQRRIFSLIELPAANAGDATTAAPGTTSPGATSPGATPSPGDLTTTPGKDVRDRSLAYFKSVQVLTDDLRKGLKDTSATSAFMERYARRIDDLPVLHIDELLLDYGDKLAETLRVMALSKREAGIRYGVRATEGSSYFNGYDYGSDAYASAAARSQAKKEEMASASDMRVQGWKLIDDATADIRRTLTKKYNVEF